MCLGGQRRVRVCALEVRGLCVFPHMPSEQGLVCNREESDVSFGAFTKRVLCFLSYHDKLANMLIVVFCFVKIICRKMLFGNVDFSCFL